MTEELNRGCLDERAAPGAAIAAREQTACKAEPSRWGAHLYICDGKDCDKCSRTVASREQEATGIHPTAQTMIDDMNGEIEG